MTSIVNLRRQHRTRNGSVTAYDQGAQLAEWVVDGVPVVWVSRRSEYAVGRGIRGGVPVCWPWFANGPSGDLVPSHGFARTSPWRLQADESQDGRVRLVWALSDADVVGRPGTELFPYPFRAELVVSVDTVCQVSLEVENTGHTAFGYEAALHSYLHVGDIREVEVTGLEDSAYYDKVLGVPARAQGQLTFSGETDRIYTHDGSVRVHDAVLGRTLAVDKSGSPHTVVWNPWAQKAAAMSDLADDEWTQMLCVEAAVVGENAVHLEPGAQHTLSTTIRSMPLHGR